MEEKNKRQSAGGDNAGYTPDFDTEAFKKRFNQIANDDTPYYPRKWESLDPAPAAPAQNRASAGRQPAPPAQSGKQVKPKQDAGKKKKKKKSKHTGLKILCVLLALILLLTGTAAAAVFYVTADYHPTKLASNGYANESSLMSSPGVTNILLMGIDTKNVNAQTRSDSMILLSIDTVHAKLKLTSFMRDMYVTVPGYGDTKLTHACAYEGPQLTVDTIELNFGIRIDAYIKIGYQLFVDLVNGIGGITVSEIDETEAWALSLEDVDIDPGTNIHLNGFEALQYCRIRKGQNDFARTERQREAITLIIKQALKTNPLKLLKLARSLCSQMECSLSRAEMIAIALKALPCVFGKIEQQQIPADDTWSNATRDGMAVLLVDTEANKKVLRNFIY